ncbi:MAG TPA: hypothetical protein VF064_12885 [Pyrinomonadaceae bacterium]
MIGKLQISVGDLSEVLRPALFLLAALASAWVFRDARRRFDSYAAATACALLALLHPAVSLPLYLIARMYQRRDADDSTTETTGDDETDEQPSTVSSDGDETAHGDAAGPGDETAHGVEAPALPRSTLAPTLVYLTAVLLVGGLYFYRDYMSFDAHFARARRAQLYNRRERAVREYRAALRLREDAHTRKLLGLELSAAGRWEEALAELRAAERGGEPDASLAFREAVALDKLNRREEAADVYRRFLQTRPCARPEPDPLCLDAQDRLGMTEAERNRRAGRE